MNPEELRNRAKGFALSTLRFLQTLPQNRSNDIIAKQLGRAATSVGTNYRAACKARSRADFVSKITVVEEEADESQYWFELLISLEAGDQKEAATLLDEARELTAIFTASGKTAKRKN